MIKIEAKEERYLYNAYHMIKAFCTSEEVEQCCDEKLEADLKLTDADGTVQEFAIDPDHASHGKDIRRELDREVYRYLARRTKRELAWGMLTGVRPAKLATKAVEQGVEKTDFVKQFREEYLVSAEKAGFAYDIAVRERDVLSALDYKDGYSLYVGIPFCPSVCSYCSFSSGPVDKWRDQIPAYLDALCKEIKYIGKVSAEKKLNSIYIGGGTPTSLEAEQLEQLLTCIDQSFSREHLLEYTVEAGRPDSITKEKLQVIKRHGVTRISINPQTMQQKTLDRIGRKHRVQEVKDIYRIARQLGFDNINMDLIAGLPGEGLEDMMDTLAQIRELAPDSLTVHSLAIKRAAQMGQEKSTLGYVRDLKEQTEHPQTMAETLSAMIDCAHEAASEMGLEPYYLYRQKNIAGNFENVGYAKVDKAGIYNILIMEEKQSIIAAGAGASTKIVLPEPVPVPGSRNGKTTTLIRVENVKNIREYIARIDEMIERKGEWLWH